MWILIGAGVAFLLLAGILLWSGRMTQTFVNAMRHAVPTKADRVADAFPGELVSITGTARSDNPMLSQRGGTPSLYYTSSVERDYERTEHTSATKDRPARTSTHRGTETMSTDTQSIEFDVEDDSGKVRVIPDGAEFDARETLNRYEPTSSIGGGSFSLGGISINMGDRDRTLGYRYRESTIALDQPVYVVGVVTENGEIAKPRNGQSNAALIISYRNENALRDDWEQSARWQAYGSIGSASVGVVLLIIAASIAIR
jgi:hypothetical protein